MCAPGLGGGEGVFLRRISRYMLRHVGVALVFITVTLVCAIWLTQSLRLIDMIINRGLPLTVFLHLSVLSLPTFLAIVFPITLFAAVLFTYNRLTMDSEIVVMRAAGVSQFGLAKPALQIAAIIVVLEYSLTLYFLPAGFREFKDMQHVIRNDYSSVLLQEGVFTNLSDSVTVYVRERLANGELLGILVHDGRIQEAPVTMMAQRGALVSTEKGPRIVMVNGNRQEVSKETGQLSLLYFDRYTVDVKSVDKSTGPRWREGRERFLDELFYPDMSSLDNRKNYQKLRAEGHQRLILPVYALTFTLIGLACLLSGDFSRRGQSKRVMVAIILILVLELGALGFNHLAARFSWAVPLMYANVLLPLPGGLYFLFRTQGRARRSGAGAVSAARL